MKKLMVIYQSLGKNGIFSKMPHIIRMVKAAKKGEYKMDTKSVLIPSIAIIYILSPIDLIPDFLLGFGAIDDILILTIAIPFIVKEVNKFLIWEEEQKLKKNSTKDIDAKIVE